MRNRTKKITKLFFGISSGLAVSAPIIFPVWDSISHLKIKLLNQSRASEYEHGVKEKQQMASSTYAEPPKYSKINEIMNGTVSNENTATSIDTLDTTANLIKTGNVSSYPITYFNPQTICDFVQLNTYNLPIGAQITYIVGFTPQEIEAHNALNAPGNATGNSLIKTYSANSGITAENSFTARTKLNVCAYSNMVYQDGVLYTSKNYLLASTSFDSEDNSPRPLANSTPTLDNNWNRSWTYGLLTNTVSAGTKTVQQVSVTNDATKAEGYYDQWTLDNSYVLPLIASKSPSSGTEQYEIDTPPEALTNIELKNQFYVNLKSLNNDQHTIKNIPIPGLNYLAPTLNVKPSLRYEIVKENLFPSEYNDSTVAPLLGFASQGFNRSEITYTRKYANDLFGRMIIELVGTPAPLGIQTTEGGQDIQVVLPYVFTIELEGFKCWMPIVIACVCAAVAFLFMVIGIILVNKTSENKKYKLVRRTL